METVDHNLQNPEEKVSGEKNNDDFAITNISITITHGTSRLEFWLPPTTVSWC